MPAALEPGGKWPVVLEIDQDKPEESRPTFYFKALSARQARQAMQLLHGLDELRGAKDITAALDEIIAQVKIGLVGWENMTDPNSGEAIAYDPDQLDTIIGYAEAVKLLDGMLKVGGPDRKNSESPA